LRNNKSARLLIKLLFPSITLSLNLNKSLSRFEKNTGRLNLSMCCRLVMIFIERESDMCQRFQQNIFTRINVSKFESCAKFDNCTSLRFFFILKLKSFNIYAFAVHCCHRYLPPVVGYEIALNNIR
jgi:hypothetical protein